jgi:hypothetical protein
MASYQQNTRCPYCDYEFTADLWPSNTSENEATTRCKQCGKKFSVLDTRESIPVEVGPIYLPVEHGTTISTGSEDYRLPTRPPLLSGKVKILLAIIVVAVILIIIFSIIQLISEKTTYTMKEFQDEFDYGNIITTKDIPSKYLDRDLYIEDTVTQIEVVYTNPYYIEIGTGMNFESTGKYTSMSQDSQYVEFDLIWDSDITDRFDEGDKVKITVIITETSGGYHFDFTKIEHI